MSKPAEPAPIRLRGVRHNNLKGFDLDLPQRRLIVVTGLSGSGKSSLAFDTLFAEGQRRYIETFSPYARQFFDRMDKPQVDSVEGIPPAIAIEQRNAVRTTRSTIGTMTEVCDHLKLLWPHLARLHCRTCGRPVLKDTPQRIWETLRESARPGERPSATEVLITFDLPLTDKLTLAESLNLVARQGYQRLMLPAGLRGPAPTAGHLGEAVAPYGSDAPSMPPEARVLRLEEAGERLAESRPAVLTVVQDRVRLLPANRARFAEACEQAFHFGKGRLAIHPVGQPDAAIPFSNRFHCAHCDIDYREPTPALFSFNHPVGACPTCRGFGRTITIDYQLAIPDRSKTLAGGAVKPWQTGVSAECQQDLLKFCRTRKVPTDVPFADLSPAHQDWVLNGDPGYGQDADHQWPRAWYGIKGYFRWLESKAYKMHVRVLLSRYRAYQPCPDCHGRRLQPESLLYRVTSPDPAAPATSLTLSDFYQLPLRDALRVIDSLAKAHPAGPADPLGHILREVRTRLGYLVDVGLGYLTLDRPTRTLSGGETERVNLTSCLGTRLVNTLYVLDEPSVGLHPRDTHRLIRILQNLRDLGNTIVVVEHEASVMRAADQIVDLGPGHGESGGRVVFQGSCAEIGRCPTSLTGGYLSGRLRIDIPTRRPVDSRANEWLRVRRATRHNLHDLAVDLPLGRLVCLTGVSGSGKTTLLREILLPGLQARLHRATPLAPPPGTSETEEAKETPDSGSDADTGTGSARIEGGSSLTGVVLVDQSPIGRTPRSNAAVYCGAFDDIRELFARSDAAEQRGLNASAFSFNSAQGQCERCRGAGFEKIEMQFLSDVFIRCPDCNGRRYRPHILEVTLAPPAAGDDPSPAHGRRTGSPAKSPPHPARSIADLLEATIDDALLFLDRFGADKSARRAAGKLRLVQEVGLGYLRLGQPINTLSGGESQRLKLVSHLVNLAPAPEAATPHPLLFLFDEPTTGLHFDDVRVLLKVFQRLTDAGHSVMVVEHNLDVIKCADWVIDLGPDAGDQGGRLVVAGTPETVARCPASHTGTALRDVLPPATPATPRPRKRRAQEDPTC